MMLEILSIISSIFIIIFLGYMSVKTKILDDFTILGIGKYVLYFALPALIIINVSKYNISNVLDPLFFLVYGVGSIITYGLSFLFFKSIFKNNTLECGIKAMGTSWSNSAFVGFPLMIQFFENPPIFAYVMILIFENVIMMPFTLAILEYANRNKDNNHFQTITQIFKNLLKNPIIIAIIISLFLSILNLNIPSALNNSLELLSKSSVAAALFFIGGSLAGNKLKDENYRDIFTVSIFKLVLHPLVIAIIAFSIPTFDAQMKTVVILFASVPMLSIYPIIGSRFGFASFCSSTILVSTIISFFTISFILIIL